MRNIILLIIGMSMTAGASAQKDRTGIFLPFDSATSLYFYDTVLTIVNTSSDVLYIRAKEWCQSKFVDKDFITDESGSKLVDMGHFVIHVYIGKALNTYTIVYKLDLSFKDNRTRLLFTNFRFSSNTQGSSEETTLEAFERMMAENKALGKKAAFKFLHNMSIEIEKSIEQTVTEFNRSIDGSTKTSDDW